jgi:hypothetical protein
MRCNPMLVDSKLIESNPFSEKNPNSFPNRFDPLFRFVAIIRTITGGRLG